MKHDIHAETATENDLVKVAAILADHRGKDNPITSGEIAEVTDLDTHDSTPKTRGVIRTLTEDYGLPIAASTKGYYMIANGAEASEYLRDLEQRMRGVQKRKDNVCEAVESRGIADSEQTVRTWVSDLETQVGVDDGGDA
jgi:hypothetical protein